MSDRPLYLLVRSGGLFKAHWAFWNPSPSSGGIGTKTHVTGDPLNGFDFEVTRMYDLAEDGGSPTVIEIGVVRSEDMYEAAEGQGVMARNRFELIAESVQPPSGSLRRNPSSTKAGSQPDSLGSTAAEGHITADHGLPAHQARTREGSLLTSDIRDLLADLKFKTASTGSSKWSLN